MIGIDLGEAISQGALKVTISQQFADHWSIDSGQSLHLKMTRLKLDPEEEEHYDALNYARNEGCDPNEDLMAGDIMLSYWTKEGYRGLFLQAGCRYGISKGPGGQLGFGYMIEIWRGIRCSLTYVTTLNSQPKSNIGFTISYVME